jgi:kynurenine formamidase
LFPGAVVYDLSQPYFLGMPHHPAHPPFLFSLTKKHGDYVHASGMSSAADSIAMSGHTGTHIDALCHFSCNGRFFNGSAVVDAQSWDKGVSELSVDTIGPIIRRGVLLDIAGAVGVETLARDFVITPDLLDHVAGRQKVEIEPGDVVLLRTGWARLWRNAREYISEVRGPGPALGGARWLSAHKVFAAGADTVAFESQPDAAMPVHVHLLVESGIHIVENLNLERLAAERLYTFTFVAAPLRIEGGTGAPVRPLAIPL